MSHINPIPHVPKALIDTNVLVYRMDPTDPAKQARAQTILDEGMRHQSIVLAHQTLVEFMAVAQRPRPELEGQGVLLHHVAVQQVEWLMEAFEVIYPDSAVMKTALRGQATFGLSWWEAHLWAYAEVGGIAEILSEDFQHGRWYGSVRVVNPFLSGPDSVHELPPMYEQPSTKTHRPT